jgi:hypothetical protein
LPLSEDVLSMSKKRFGKNILSSKSGLSESDARRLEDFRLKRDEDLRELERQEEIRHLSKNHLSAPIPSENPEDDEVRIFGMKIDVDS